VRTDLLAALQRHLEKLEATIPRKRKRRFDMSTYYKRGTKSCGTAACALGEACFVPELRRAGLRLCRASGTFMVPEFKNAIGYAAAMDLFDISFGDAMDLFNPDHYTALQNIKPKHVAVRIAKLIEKHS